MSRPRPRGTISARSTVSMVPVAPWLGNITQPWCQECSWAVLAGVLTVKYINRACAAHGHVLREKGPVQGR